MAYSQWGRAFRPAALSPLIVMGLATLFAGSAQAGLGAKRDSIDLDRLHMAANVTATTDTGNYVIHDLTLSSGTVAREFTRSDGVVFAVSWQGPIRPDLKQLFGDYFPRFQADNVQTGRIRMRRALSSNHLDFIVQTGGHSGASWGYAVLPQMTPSGFTYEALQ